MDAEQPGNHDVMSVNAVVGETNDGFLNDIRARAITREHVLDAIGSARGGLLAEGSIGAGTGTMCFGWKGGIGTSFARVADAGRGHTRCAGAEQLWRCAADGWPAGWQNAGALLFV